LTPNPEYATVPCLLLVGHDGPCEFGVSSVPSVPVVALEELASTLSGLTAAYSYRYSYPVGELRRLIAEAR
jgi:hypothetical protein